MFQHIFAAAARKNDSITTLVRDKQVVVKIGELFIQEVAAEVGELLFDLPLN